MACQEGTTTRFSEAAFSRQEGAAPCVFLNSPWTFHSRLLSALPCNLVPVHRSTPKHTQVLPYRAFLPTSVSSTLLKGFVCFSDDCLPKSQTGNNSSLSDKTESSELSMKLLGKEGSCNSCHRFLFFLKECIIYTLCVIPVHLCTDLTSLSKKLVAAA